MSHASFAIVVVGLGAGIGMLRARSGTHGALGIAVALGALAVGFHLLELLVQ